MLFFVIRNLVFLEQTQLEKIRQIFVKLPKIKKIDYFKEPRVPSAAIIVSKIVKY